MGSNNKIFEDSFAADRVCKGMSIGDFFYLAQSTAIAVTWGTGTLVLQLPSLMVRTAAALPVGTELGPTPAGLLYHLQH